MESSVFQNIENSHSVTKDNANQRTLLFAIRSPPGFTLLTSNIYGYT